MIRLAINGFGRIGRQAFKIAMEHPDVDVVAINDLSNVRQLAYLLKYDTAYGFSDFSITVKEGNTVIDFDNEFEEIDYSVEVEHKDVFLVADDDEVQVLGERDPANLPWGELDIDVVLECTGFFTKDGAARAHIDAGAKKVVVSAPTKGGDIKTFLRGVNHEDYNGDEVISNASCTTNCASPVARVMDAAFGIEKAMLTTVHAVTSTQSLVDGLPPMRSSDMRRGRAAMMNITPSTTGAAVATTGVLPSLEGKFDGIAIRVPVITGSLTDFTFLLKRQTTVEEINEAFLQAIESPFYEGVLRVTYDPIVSSDIIGDPHSAVVDLSMTTVVGGDMVKVLAWYDNEWGYSNRLVEMAVEIGM